MKFFTPIVFGSALALFAAGCIRQSVVAPGVIAPTALLARVVTISAVPDPADAPYEDCLTHLKLEAVNAAGGFEPGDSLIVVAWGFRDRVLSGGAVLRPGDSILIEPVAFETVEQTHRHTMRVDDTGDFESPLYWAEKIGFVDSETQRRVQLSLGETRSVRDLLTVQRSGVERILQVLEAYGGKPTGLFYGEFAFIDYEYIYADEYLKPAGERIDDFGVSPLEAILGFKRLLDSHGVELVVIFPPRAAAIFPDYASGLSWNFAVKGRVDLNFVNFVGQLRSNGVDVVDVVPDFIADRYEQGPEGVDYPVYLRRNPHWSSGGAKRAARLVAQAVKRQDWFKRYESGEDHDEFQFQPRVEVATLRNPYAAMENGDERFSVLLHRVEPELGFESYTDATNFKAPIQLIGDSFSWFEADRQASFYDHLVAQIGLPVGMTALGAGATTTALDQWLRRGDLAATRVVVWEIVASNLAYPDRWRRTALLEEPVLDLVQTFDSSRSSIGLLTAIRDNNSVASNGFRSSPLMSLMVRGKSGAAPPLEQRSNWKDVSLGPAARFRCRVKNLPMKFEGQGSVAYEIFIDGMSVARRVVEGPQVVLWSDWEVDLSAFAGHGVDFSLQIEIKFNGPHRPPAGWGDPEILDAQILTDGAKTVRADDPS